LNPEISLDSSGLFYALGINAGFSSQKSKKELFGSLSAGLGVLEIY
jgi:hypothetical protein